MSKKINDYHLYRFDKKVLSKLDSLELKFERKDIQNIFENNLNDFFPKLEFLKREHSFAVSQNRVDSIAYHIRENTFFIIEYKTLKGAKGGKVKNQALNYLNDLKDDLEEQFNLVNSWNKERGEQLWLSYKDIKWEKAKVICISPFFHPHESSDKEAILIKIEKYEGDILYLEGKFEQLELLGIKKLLKKEAKGENNSGKGKERANNLTLTVNIEHFLSERGIKESKMKEWILEINNFLENKCFLRAKFFTKSQSKSSWHVKYSRNKIPILSLVPQQKFINVYLNKLTNDDLSLKLVKKYELKDYRSIGHSGEIGNDWQYTINDTNSFSNFSDLFINYLKKI